MLDQSADLGRVFHALADPGRRVMVERLSTGPASVSELGRPLAMSLAAVLRASRVLDPVMRALPRRSLYGETLPPWRLGNIVGVGLWPDRGGGT
jgi:DNA-binding transcriptional ArsR family regulator